jgi:hypothetical protein
MSVSSVLLVLFLASLGTIWTVWPDKYQRWVDGLFLGWGPAPQAAKARVRSIWPFSMSSKPWYPRFLRVVGVLIWVVLLGMAYLFYRSSS